MPPLKVQWRSSCSVLYPLRCRQPIRLLHFQPSERRCKGKSLRTQRQEKSDILHFRSDLGLIEGDPIPRDTADSQESKLKAYGFQEHSSDPPDQECLPSSLNQDGACVSNGIGQGRSLRLSLRKPPFIYQVPQDQRLTPQTGYSTTSLTSRRASPDQMSSVRRSSSTHKGCIVKCSPRSQSKQKDHSITSVNELHQLIFLSFQIRGDLAQLRGICIEGILATFRIRINTRPKGEINRWTLHKYFDNFYSLTPRIVSTRMGRLPSDESVMMQVVVKVKSTQSLQKFTQSVGGKEDTVIPGPEEGPKTLVEYVVLQRMMIEGEEKKWMIWGTMQESKVEDVIGEENPVGSPAIGNP